MGVGADVELLWSIRVSICYSGFSASFNGGESIPVGNIISMGTSAAPFSFSLKFVGVIEGKSLQTYYTLYHIMNSNCNFTNS